MELSIEYMNAKPQKKAKASAHQTFDCFANDSLQVKEDQQAGDRNSGN